VVACQQALHSHSQTQRSPTACSSHQQKMRLRFATAVLHMLQSTRGLLKLFLN
jgi:hypothetical protein